MSYGLSDFLLFSARTYWRLLGAYGRSVFPLQVFFLLSGLLLLWCTTKAQRTRRSLCAFVVQAVPAMAWVWSAVFHWKDYATINWAAKWFAAAFLLEAALLIGRARPTKVAALVILAYPFIAPILGRPWATAEVFGTHPDPTAVATLGMILQAKHRWPLAVIPLLWCAIGGATLYELGSPEWFVAPLAAVAFVVAGVRKTNTEH